VHGNLVIIDYGMGNLRSVQKAFAHLGTEALISGDPDTIARADRLVLPGVGHFATGVRKLKATGIWPVLNQKVLQEKTPILGICLGMQLMARHSEEGDCEGLGWFDARVVRFRVSDPRRHKVPHMGWNTAERPRPSAFFTDVPATAQFYFVHSYHLVCADPQDTLAVTEYDYPFASVIGREHIVGTQFHPEKSHDWGRQLLANFLVTNPIHTAVPR